MKKHQVKKCFFYGALRMETNQMWYWNSLMKGFHFVVLLTGGSGIHDTQIIVYFTVRGFKMCTWAAARKLFTNIRLKRYTKRLGNPFGISPVRTEFWRRCAQSAEGQGGYDKEDKATRAYDLAAMKYWGPTTNFPVEYTLQVNII
ncbi:hypothetical protein IFM89_007583 [Coptis chinensis]|uniref:AP2/ERF domain-containing protein n=1 Tax=Coptis chinensis TaxID=261450 RepID=A0A835GXT4_9MAGN|nr:hypothetical protein IFM89_007583 [Coptis chinensis]